MYLILTQVQQDPNRPITQIIPFAFATTKSVKVKWIVILSIICSHYL